MPDSTSAKIETVVANGETYELLSLLGVGAMGSVYRARQCGLDRIVALKKLRSHLYADQSSLHRFRREAKAAAGLNSRNIVRVFSFAVTENNEALLVMEYVEGKCLSEFFDGKPLPRPQFVSFFKQILSALISLHEAGIVHRDLKPANVMVTTDGVIKLTDFGIAKTVETGSASQRTTQTGAVIGTPLYMSPEQCRGEQADSSYLPTRRLTANETIAQTASPTASLDHTYESLEKLNQIENHNSSAFQSLQRETLVELQALEDRAREVHDNKALGRIRQRRGTLFSLTDSQKAIAEWKAALPLLTGTNTEIVRERVGTYQLLAHACKDMGKPEEGLHFVEQGVADTAGFPDRSFYWQALVNEGVYLNALGRYRRAKPLFETVLQQTREGPAASESHMQLGMAETVAHGYTDQALYHFVHASQIAENEIVDRDTPGIYVPWLRNCALAHLQTGTCYAAQHDKKNAQLAFANARQRIEQFVHEWGDDGALELYETTYAKSMCAVGEDDIAMTTLCSGLERCLSHPRPALSVAYLEGSKWMFDRLKQIKPDQNLAARFTSDYNRLKQQTVNQAAR